MLSGRRVGQRYVCAFCFEFLSRCNGRSPCFPSWTVELSRVQLLMSRFLFRDRAGILEFSLWCFFRKRRRDLCKPDPATRCILQDSGLLARLSCEAFFRHQSFADPLGHPRLGEGLIWAEVPARQGVACHQRLTQKWIFSIAITAGMRGQAARGTSSSGGACNGSSTSERGTQTSEGGVIRARAGLGCQSCGGGFARHNVH